MLGQGWSINTGFIVMRVSNVLFDVLCEHSRAALEDSKKWGMLNVVNQLFKIYFKVMILVVLVRVQACNELTFVDARWTTDRQLKALICM